MQESGQSMVEYALILSLIAFAAFTGLSACSDKVQRMWNNIYQNLRSYLHI